MDDVDRPENLRWPGWMTTNPWRLSQVHCEGQRGVLVKQPAETGLSECVTSTDWVSGALSSGDRAISPDVWGGTLDGSTVLPRTENHTTRDLVFVHLRGSRCSFVGSPDESQRNHQTVVGHRQVPSRGAAIELPAGHE